MIISKDIKTIHSKNICSHNKIFSKSIIEKNVVLENNSLYEISEMIHKNENESNSYFIENKVNNVINLLSRLSVYSVNNENNVEQKSNCYMQNSLMKQIKKELNNINLKKSINNGSAFRELNTLINNEGSTIKEETINSLITKINLEKKNNMIF